MADSTLAVPENIEGSFFVDKTCIDCDTCRQIDPSTFADAGSYSYVHSQPHTVEQIRAASRALLSCPTGSIGTRTVPVKSDVRDDFPLKVVDNVFYCGFNSRKSYGANSYFIEDPEGGNWLIDAPRYVEHLVRQFEKRGGLKYIFLTHRDDVADADRYASRFGAKRIIHREDLCAMPDCEIVLEHRDEVDFAGATVIPVPGHTEGHMVLLYRGRFLFTGDHLYLDRKTGRTEAFKDFCWYSFLEQTASMEKLSKYDFEWILPGHGDRGFLPLPEMKQQMSSLVARMQESGS